MVERILLTVLVALLGVAPAAAKEYYASRFDVRVEVLRGGSLRVVETIVFTFTEGTFREVFRTIPTRRTDGVEFVSAAMDGRALPQGEGAGIVTVRRQNGLRVEWHFGPVGASTHTFELTYVARGVVQRTPNADLLRWAALPREHDYRIESSTVEFVAPEGPASPPQIDTNRIESEPSVAVTGSSTTVQAANIRRNGTLTISLTLPQHSVLDAPPAWQARDDRLRERMPVWFAAAGFVALIGCVMLFAIRQNYDSPPRDARSSWDSLIPPDHASPAIAGTLMANGRPHLEHAMAALFSLAERGVIAIREERRGAFGTRQFAIERVRSSAGLPPHEQAALDIVFDGATNIGAYVTLAKARAELSRPRRWKQFKSAVLGELSAAQMLDAGRQASRGRYRTMAVVLFIVGLLAVIPCAVLAPEHGPGPFLIPLAICAVALASIIVMSSQTPLSNEGVRRAERWRAFKRHISDPQAIEPRWGAAGTAEARILPFAIALGLASAWSKYLKKRNADTPAWFHAASGLDSGHAFAAFVASGGASAHGHSSAGGGVGGAAGGGASGAH